MFHCSIPGADITRDDGIYSRYFTQFTGLGFYGMKVRVENNGEALIVKPSARSPYSGVDMYFNPELLLAGNLSEFGIISFSYSMNNFLKVESNVTLLYCDSYQSSIAPLLH